ncbi:MAG: NUDIX hydrolase [Isosphaeraceae bacterium]
MIRPFARQRSRVVLETPIFSLREDDATHPRTGVERTYYVLQSPTYVNVVALTTGGKLILVRQWRHGIRDICLELPAGLAEPGESPEHAAARELLEETGYEAGRVTLLGQVQPNPAHQDNLLFTVLAEDCREVEQGPGPDEGEDIEVELIEPADLAGLYRSGVLQNAMVVCGLFRWLDSRGRIAWPTSDGTPPPSH